MFRAGTLGEKLFWAVMIVICSGLTIMDVYDSVQLFLISPTSTRVFVSSNQSISLGSPTLCVDLDMSNFTYSRINLAEPKTVDQLLATFVGEDVMEFLRRNFEAVQLIRENNSDPMSLFNYNSTPLDETYENKRILPLLSLTAVMLSNIIRAEHYVNSSGLRADFAWGVPMNTREERSFGRYADSSNFNLIKLTHVVELIIKVLKGHTN